MASSDQIVPSFSVALVTIPAGFGSMAVTRKYRFSASESIPTVVCKRSGIAAFSGVKDSRKSEV